MVINTTLDFKSYLAKFGLNRNKVSEITGLSTVSITKKMRTMNWKLNELGKIVAYTGEPIIINGKEGE